MNGPVFPMKGYYLVIDNAPINTSEDIARYMLYMDKHLLGKDFRT